MGSASSETSGINPPNSSRFSSSSLLSVRTLPPQYDALEATTNTALVANGSHGPPPYGPLSSSIPTSASATLTTSATAGSSRSRFSRCSIRTLPPQYSDVDVLEERASTASVAIDADSYGVPPYGLSSPNIRTSASAGATEQPREVVLTWSSTTTTPICDRTSEFHYSYPIRSKRPWATLHLRTRDAILGNPNPLLVHPRVPRFWSCDPIVGSLQLDLDGPHNIQQINVSLIGRIIMSSASEMKFLGHEFTLWDKSMGDPVHSDANNTPKKKFDGRFSPGQYSFPFSFHFPTHPHTISKSGALTNPISPFPPLAAGITQDITPSATFHLPKYKATNREKEPTSRFAASSVSPARKVETEPSASQKKNPDRSQPSVVLHRGHRSLASPLPQSFMEKSIKPSVSYEISVSIVHGRFRASSRIKTDIVYIPALQPLPAPQKRREAYEEAASLLSPMDNFDGWLAWPTLTQYGIVNPETGPRHTKADCTLFLAQPLSYTRGSVIPCFLKISSDDDQLVRLLSSPKSPTVRLLRHIRHPKEDDQTAPDDGASEGHGDLTITWGSDTWRPHTTGPTGETQLVKHEVGRAQWWMPMKDVAQSPNVRHLEGEIHLSPNLQPSCDFRFFQVEYTVELLSFQTDDFEPEIHSSLGKSREGDNVLASIPVEITTLYRQDEPVPTAYSEPPKIYIRRLI